MPGALPQEPNVGVEPGGAPQVAPLKIATKVSTEDATKIIEQTRGDLQAIDEAGSVQGAIEAGHKFASGDGINRAKLNLPGEVDDFVATTADVLEANLNAAKGGAVLSDAKVEAQVRGMASYFNIEPSTIMGRIAQGGQDATKMVANMEAAFLLSNRMHTDAFTLAARIGLGDFAGFATREAAVEEFKRQVTMASSMFASGQSMRAAFGRGLAEVAA
jgi:hypothetical protein